LFGFWGCVLPTLDARRSTRPKNRRGRRRRSTPHKTKKKKQTLSFCSLKHAHNNKMAQNFGARASSSGAAAGGAAPYHPHRAVPATAAAPPPAAAAAAAPPHSPTEIFLCDEESRLFSRGVARFLERESRLAGTGVACARLSVQELGAGDGRPVLAALSSLSLPPSHQPPSPRLAVRAFESCPRAAALARRNAAAATPDIWPHSYEVSTGDFFEAAANDNGNGSGCLVVANPPYLPAPSSSGLLLPGLYGGPDGASVTRRLLALGGHYRAALLIVAGVANPRSVLKTARLEGWRVRTFEAERLPFGLYTSQPSVRSWIARLEREGLAHTLSDGYMCAAVEFERQGGGGEGLEARLLEVLTATATAATAPGPTTTI
jgi:hypothetical protein